MGRTGSTWDALRCVVHSLVDIVNCTVVQTADGMTSLDNGFYAAFVTESGGQGLVMLVFRDGKIAGVDAGGVSFDGTYSASEGGFALKMKLQFPPNTQKINGERTGPETEISELQFHLPDDFLSRAFIRI